jgi:hypothetical protein
MLAILWARIPLLLKIAVVIILAVLAAYQFGRGGGEGTTPVSRPRWKPSKRRRAELLTWRRTMRTSGASRLVIVALCSCATAGCQTAAAINGRGYQFVGFQDAAAAKAASQDPLAGRAIATNNVQARSCSAG